MRNWRILLISCGSYQLSLGFAWQPAAAARSGSSHHLLLNPSGAVALVKTRRRTTALSSLKWNKWVEDQVRQERKRIDDQPYEEDCATKVVPLIKLPITCVLLVSFVVHDLWGFSSHSSMILNFFSFDDMLLNLVCITVVVWVNIIFGGALDLWFAFPVTVVFFAWARFLDTFVLLPGQWVARSVNKMRAIDQVLARSRIDPQRLRDEQDCHAAIQRMLQQTQHNKARTARKIMCRHPHSTHCTNKNSGLRRKLTKE